MQILLRQFLRHPRPSHPRGRHSRHNQGRRDGLSYGEQLARAHRSQRHPRPGAPGPRGRCEVCAGPGGARVHLREGGGEVAGDTGGGGRCEEIAVRSRMWIECSLATKVGIHTRSDNRPGIEILGGMP